MIKSVRFKILVLSLVCNICILNVSMVAQTLESDTTFTTAENLVTELYKAVTFKAGEKVDWKRVKSMFLEQAVIVLRTSRDSSSVFNVNGFVDDFVNFIYKYRVDTTGFSERIVKMKPMVFGDIAHVLVLYEAQIIGSKRTPQQGVDSFELIRRNGRWWITTIVNEIPTKQRPVPIELQ